MIFYYSGKKGFGLIMEVPNVIMSKVVINKYVHKDGKDNKACSKSES